MDVRIGLELRGKKKEVLELLNKCRVCSELKKTPPRPRVGMPVANTFNEVVGLDLKVLGNSKYILWIVDMFSKAIKGCYIEDKTPETIVNAIIKTWIIGGGFGPGHPSRGFYSDNGERGLGRSSGCTGREICIKFSIQYFFSIHIFVCPFLILVTLSMLVFLYRELGT